MRRFWEFICFIPPSEVWPKTDADFNLDPIRDWLLLDGSVALRKQCDSLVHWSNHHGVDDRLFCSIGPDLRKLSYCQLLGDNVLNMRSIGE